MRAASSTSPLQTQWATLSFTVTVEDPTTFTRPWTAVQELTKNSDQKNQVYEGGCHEGNYGMIGMLANIAGLALGIALSLVLIFVINKQSFGWTIELHTPVRLIAASLVVTFLSAVLAGLAPARFAARVNMAAALKSE